MQFRTQEELLRHLWKSNDRNLIKRLVARGEVWKENWMYCIAWEEEEKPDLKFISKAMGEKVLDHGEIIRLNEELEKYKVWLDQANKAYDDLVAEKEKELQGITKRCRDYMLQRKCPPTQTKQEFEYRILGKEYADVQFSPDDLPF